MQVGCAVAVGVTVLYVLIFGERRRGYGLLTTEQMKDLVFPVVIRTDDGEMSFHPSAQHVFSTFEPQDLDDSEHYGWDSRGRRFCFDGWELNGEYRFQEASSSGWAEFDRCLSESYKAAPEIAAWREAAGGAAKKDPESVD